MRKLSTGVGMSATLEEIAVSASSELKETKGIRFDRKQN